MTLEKTDSVVHAIAFPADLGEVSSTEGDVEYDEKMTRQLVRKIDRHILPVLAILYLLSFLDRTNIGNARLANLEIDLHMTGLNYNVSLAYPNLSSACWRSC